MKRVGQSGKQPTSRRTRSRDTGIGLALALPVLGLLAPEASLAQEAEVERCRRTTSADARIACLERALTGRQGGAPSRSADPSQPESAPEPAPERPPAGSPPAPAHERAERAVEPSGIGAEQVRARNESAAEREARLASAAGLRVVAYREVPYQRLEVELENGQVWRQIKGDTQHIRVDLSRNRTVDIEESSLGGYKLQLNEMRRTVRVERVK